METFNFLGFTFYCGRSRKGMPYIMPKTSSKKFRQKIQDIKVWLYANRDQSLKKLIYTREGFIEMLKYYPLAMPKIYVSLF